MSNEVVVLGNEHTTCTETATVDCRQSLRNTRKCLLESEETFAYKALNNLPVVLPASVEEGSVQEQIDAPSSAG